MDGTQVQLAEVERFVMPKPYSETVRVAISGMLEVLWKGKISSEDAQNFALSLVQHPDLSVVFDEAQLASRDFDLFTIGILSMIDTRKQAIQSRREELQLQGVDYDLLSEETTTMGKGLMEKAQVNLAGEYGVFARMLPAYMELPEIQSAISKMGAQLHEDEQLVMIEFNKIVLPNIFFGEKLFHEAQKPVPQ